MGMVMHDEDPPSFGTQIDNHIKTLEDRVRELESSVKKEKELTVDRSLFANRIAAAIETINEYGPMDGAHHKDWALQEVLKILLGTNETKLLEHLSRMDWERGIAP